jgi:hypothetical protein
VLGVAANAAEDAVASERSQVWLHPAAWCRADERGRPAAAGGPPRRLFGESNCRFWILLRGAEPGAVLDADGCAHFRDRQLSDLLLVYLGAG